MIYIPRLRAVGLKNPSAIGVYPVIWPLSVCRAPQGGVPVLVGGTRRRQDVADVLDALVVAHTFTLPRARRWSRASPVSLGQRY